MKGQIRRRGARSWAIVIDLPPGQSGKRRQKWHSVKGTKKDAEREMARLRYGEGQELFLNKRPLREIADELDSDIETVRKWVQK